MARSLTSTVKYESNEEVMVTKTWIDNFQDAIWKILFPHLEPQVIT